MRYEIIESFEQALTAENIEKQAVFLISITAALHTTTTSLNIGRV